MYSNASSAARHGSLPVVRKSVYIFGDVDRVREQFDRHLFSGDIAALQSFSTGLTSAISDLACSIKSAFGGDIIVAGGDELIILLSSKSRYNSNDLLIFTSNFMTATGCKISFGVSDSLERAYLNLRKAKAAGGGVIIQDGSKK